MTFLKRKFLIIALWAAVLASCGNLAPAVVPAANPTSSRSQATIFSPTLTSVEIKATPIGSETFRLTSPTVTEGGMLPLEYTCDGSSSTLALSWSGAPAGTRNYAVIMHHVASPTDIHWYWVLYNIPASVTSLPQNVTGIGTLGTNSVNDRTAYTPPCSKGPGPKVYTYTVYALSGEPQLSVPASQVNRAVLLDAIQKITLASAELHVVYSRK